MWAKCSMNPGHGNDASQDRLLIYDSILANGRYEAEWSDAKNGCVAIFDGVGGIEGGAFASGYAATQMWNYPMAVGDKALYSYLQGISSVLQRHNGCATTASGVVFVQESCYLFHIGNTRIWKSENQYLKQLTTDQTYIEEANRPLSRGDIERFGHIITGCLGSNAPENSKRLLVQDVTQQLKQWDRLVFTCDGIHDYVDVYDMEQVVFGDMDLSSLVKRARENGSDDDCSIMILGRE